MQKWAPRVVLALAAGALLAQGTASAADPLRITKPVQVTKDDLNPGRTYNAPNLLADPSNPNHIVGAFADFRTRRCNLVRSTDGGQSWKVLSDSSPAPDAYPSCMQNNSNIFHGELAFGGNGTLYYLTSGWDVEDRELSKLNAPATAAGNRLGNFSVVLGRSTNLGDTWEHTIVRNARGKQGDQIEDNRPVTGLVVQPRGGSDDIVHATWQRSLPAPAAPNQEPNRVMAAVSTDGGRTFSEPTDLTSEVFKSTAVRSDALKLQSTVTTLPPAGASTTSTTAPAAGSRVAKPDDAVNFGGRNPAMTMDGKGNVYVLWHSSTANLTPAPPLGYFLSKSTDKGKTWSTAQAGSFDRRNGFGSRLAWSGEGGPNGTLHWVAMGNEDPDIASYGTVYYRQSTDGGAKWSERKRIPEVDPKELKGQYIPNIATAPNGRIDVAWWDTRDDPGIRSNDVYYANSNDNGKTWSKNVRITDQSINRTYGVWGTNFDMNSPPGIASTDRVAVFSWDDTRFTDTKQGDSATLGGGTSDIFSAAVQFEAVGGGTSAATKVVLAGVVGLMAVGLILVVVALAARRRAGGPPLAKQPGAKAPAGVS